MSIFDEMYDYIGGALSADTCDYSVYSAMFDLIAKAETENAKLWEYTHSLEVANIDMASRLEDYIGQYDPTDAFVIDVKAKNAKLCELVRNLYACNGSCHRCVELLGKCEYEKQLRDLGIEVEA